MAIKPTLGALISAFPSLRIANLNGAIAVVLGVRMALTRIQKTARRALQKDVAKTISRLAKPDWRASQGWLFRENAGWFEDAWISVWPEEPKSSIALHTKPMSIDPLLWEIVETPENCNQPLSFRLFGAWTIQTPAFFEDTFEDSEMDAERISRRLILSVSEQTDAMRRQQQLPSLLELTTARPGKRVLSACRAAKVCTLILLEKREEAVLECQTALLSNEIGGYMIGRRSFYDLALAWLESSHGGGGSKG